MEDRAKEPEATPAPTHQVHEPAWWTRGPVLLGIGMGIGLAVGIVLMLTLSVATTVMSIALPQSNASIQVFNELNELRQQINEMNEERKTKDKEKEEAIRQALTAITSTARPPAIAKSGTASMPGMPPKAPNPPVVKRPGDPFADLDEEIARLEHTQKVLNTILDMFPSKREERPKVPVEKKNLQ